MVSVLYLVTDLAMTIAAFVTAYGVRSFLGTFADLRLGPLASLVDYFPLLLLILVFWALVAFADGLYGRRASRSLGTEVSRVARTVGVSGLLVAFGLFTLSGEGTGGAAFRLEYVSRPVILLFLLLNGPFVVAGRSLVRAFVLDLTTRRHVLVAGNREQVLRTAVNVDSHRDWGLQVVGLISDGTWTHPGASGHEVLGTLEEVPNLVRLQVVDEVIVALEAGRLDEMKRLEPMFLQLEEQGIVLRLLVNFLPKSLADISFDELGGMPLLTFSTAPRNELLLFVRRCVDASVSLALLVLLSPLFLIIAAAIKISSTGPVLFRQTRCGLNGRPFTFLKFRSMFTDADALKPSLRRFNEMDGPAFKMTNDPRVTPVGRFLRRTSLDELPQLWNILLGDMSFVGPRPAVLEEVAQYQPWQRRRLSMQPGLTCLWQVSGRNELSFDEWMRLDLEYIDNWSLWLDVKIALRTIPAVLFGRGAR
jgi:exopolysaccharide biosynthesis polyprenyl glycosylphosphotransferase